MGLMLIFTFVVVLSALGIVKTFHDRNYLGLFFSGATFLVFSFFVVATVVTQGYPAVH